MTSRGKKFFILRSVTLRPWRTWYEVSSISKTKFVISGKRISRRITRGDSGVMQARSLRAYDLPISRVKDFVRLRRVNGQQALQVPACFALIERLREGSRRDLRKDFFKVEPLPIPLELVAENELIAFPLRQMRHENAAGGIFAVTPERSVSSRFLVPPSHTQARNFSAGFFQMNLLDY